MRKKYRNCNNVFLLIFLTILVGCNNNGKKTLSELEQIEAQYALMLETARSRNANPRTVLPDGTTQWCKKGFDWTEGFFSGACWLLYEMSNDVRWKQAGEEFQSLFRAHTNASSHDVGFVFNCSYGKAFQITQDSSYIEILKEAGRNLVSRFNPKVGCIKSWDTDKGWQSIRGWQYPVIIDNMMNLELLFELTRITGDSIYYQCAITHANTTMKNHFRINGSSYHVVDYDSITGSVRHRQTAQGYSDESSWARGQAWGLYGYTMCYRYTHEQKYLEMAERIASYIINHQSIPEDKIPYWDYDIPQTNKMFRDVSAATITASALYELGQYVFNNKLYFNYADEILKSLQTDKYLAAVGTNNYFLLKHSVGSIPHGSEVDVPINYADYYFLEAIKRQKQCIKRN